MEKRYEEHAYVLDFLSHGKPGFRPTGRAGYRAGAFDSVSRRRILHSFGSFGERRFNAQTRWPCLRWQRFPRRSNIHYWRIGFEELTASAKAELPSVISKVVMNREKWFVNFFNYSTCNYPSYACLRTSSRHRQKIHVASHQRARSKALWKFWRFGKNVPSCLILWELITKRVMEELEGESKYRLFTRAQ